MFFNVTLTSFIFQFACRKGLKPITITKIYTRFTNFSYTCTYSSFYFQISNVVVLTSRTFLTGNNARKCLVCNCVQSITLKVQIFVGIYFHWDLFSRTNRVKILGFADFFREWVVFWYFFFIFVHFSTNYGVYLVKLRKKCDFTGIYFG